MSEKPKNLKFRLLRFFQLFFCVCKNQVVKTHFNSPGLVRVHDSLPYVNIGTIQLLSSLSFKRRLTSFCLKIDVQERSSLNLTFYLYFSLLNKFTIMLEIFVFSMCAAYQTRDFRQKSFISSTPSSNSLSTQSSYQNQSEATRIYQKLPEATRISQKPVTGSGNGSKAAGSGRVGLGHGSKVQTRFHICLGERCELPGGVRAEPRQPNGVPLFSALRIVSLDTNMWNIMRYIHAISIEG